MNVLNHLGLNLYSNVPAVLSEMVANAWDADAARVDISVKEQGNDKIIVVKDNGCGMDDTDLRDKFLTIGYQRRSPEKGDQTPSGRAVMGRKGIGKLSAFSIAGKVQVITKKKSSETLAIELDVEKIQEAIKNKQLYHPPAIKAPQTVDVGPSGTVLILSNLKKRVNTSLDKNLRQRVARRFSIISGNFQVFIDEKAITLSDRNYFEKLEYALVYGDYNKSNFKHDEEHIVQRVDNTVDKQENFSVNGWIGLVKESITEGRLDVIKKLSEHISDDALEKIIQQHIYNHLWLLDPSWDRATETPAMEQSVTKAFQKISGKLIKDEKNSCLDIGYKKTSGKHVIIELKGGSVKISSNRLMDQVDKYIQALTKLLREANESISIEVICLVGADLSDWEDSERRQMSEKSMNARNIRVITYQQLIKDAEESYQAYSCKSKRQGTNKNSVGCNRGKLIQWPSTLTSPILHTQFLTPQFAGFPQTKRCAMQLGKS